MDTPYSQWNWLKSLGDDAGQMIKPFPGELPGLVLLSDKNAEVIETYGVKPLNINGSVYASRATFVIDKQGKLRYVNYDYKVKEDYEPLMRVLAELE